MWRLPFQVRRKGSGSGALAADAAGCVCCIRAEKRLKHAFPGIVYEVHGTPKDAGGAAALAAADKYQFQWWAVSLGDAVPFGGKKGADGGIDGLI